MVEDETVLYQLYKTVLDTATVRSGKERPFEVVKGGASIFRKRCEDLLVELLEHRLRVTGHVEINTRERSQYVCATRMLQTSISC
jgi:hypothetical protein